MTKKKNKCPEYPQIREEWDGRRQFTIHGAVYERCSGIRTFLEFEIPNVTKRRPDETEGCYQDRVALASNMKFFKKFPEKGQSIGKLRLQLEEIWNGLSDPIKFGGCKAIKIHFEDEPENVFHWI